MKALVVYDSVFGNTEKVAQAIGQALEEAAEVKTIKVKDVKPEDMVGLDGLVVGSPTRAFSPTPATTKWLKSLPKGSLKGVKVTAFDTRFNAEDAPSAVLKGMVKVFGYAAEPIGDRLKKKGGDLQIEPEGFFVLDTEGPIKEGELERAAAWIKDLLK